MKLLFVSLVGLLLFNACGDNIGDDINREPFIIPKATENICYCSGDNEEINISGRMIIASFITVCSSQDIIDYYLLNDRLFRDYMIPCEVKK